LVVFFLRVGLGFFVVGFFAGFGFFFAFGGTVFWGEDGFCF